MKNKNLKLSLKKETIAILNSSELGLFRGGVYTSTYTEVVTTCPQVSTADYSEGCTHLTGATHSPSVVNLTTTLKDKSLLLTNYSCIVGPANPNFSTAC